MIRAAIQDHGSIYFDHDIFINGGLPKKTIVLTTKRFFNIPGQALKEHGSNLTEIDSI